MPSLKLCVFASSSEIISLAKTQNFHTTNSNFYTSRGQVLCIFIIYFAQNLTVRGIKIGVMDKIGAVDPFN